MAGLDEIAGAVGVGNKTLDRAQDEANWEKMSIIQKAESGVARTIESIGQLVFLDNMSNEAAADRIKAETAYFKSHPLESSKDKTPPKPKEGAPPTPTLKIKTEEASAPPTKIDAKTTQISVPTTPALSTVNSPAAITPEGDPKAKRPGVPETAESIMGPVMDKPDGNKDINTVLRHSSDILEAILLASNQLVEVNKDILKYSRISA
jgi:hypothetical protein